jgi:RNA polymerase sigma-70 factor (ECF subfamily)
MATTTQAQTIISRARIELRSQVPEQYWELIDRYRPELVAQALSILNSREDAEDVVQETFCDAVRDPQKLAQADSIGSWLHSLNRCNALNRLRDKKRASGRLEKQQAEAAQTFTTGGFSVLELRDSVAKAIRILPQNMQSVIKLRYWEGLGCKEIGARLNIPEGSVKRLLFEANNKLYDKLKAVFESKPVTEHLVPEQIKAIFASENTEKK